MRGLVINVLRLEPSPLVMRKVRKPGVCPERGCECCDLKYSPVSSDTSPFGKGARMSRSLGYTDAVDKGLKDALYSRETRDE